MDSLLVRDYVSAMGWRFLQITVATGFLFANVHWQWMSNPYVVSVNAGFLAMFVTWLLSKAIDLSRYLRGARRPVQQRGDQSRNARISHR